MSNEKHKIKHRIMFLDIPKSQYHIEYPEQHPLQYRIFCHKHDLTERMRNPVTDDMVLNLIRNQLTQCTI